MSSFNWLRFKQDFRANGVAVIEGVAGVGKTYGIQEVKKGLGEEGRRDVAKRAIERLKILEIPSQDATKDSQKLRGLGQPDTAAGCLHQAFLASSTFDWFKSLLEAREQPPRITTVVMHPSQTYEDLVGGLRPIPNQSGFKWTRGVVLEAMKSASDDIDKGRSHLLVLDEINRCNLAAVFGELFLVLDASKRVTHRKWQSAYSGFLASGFNDKQARAAVAEYMLGEGLAVKLSNAAKDNGEEDEVAFWPENLFILGTMNSSDRSIVAFDQALRRRFPPTRMNPHAWQEVYERVKKGIAAPGDEVNCLFDVVVWAAVNAVLRSVAGPDAMLGHSYWYALDVDGKNVNQESVRRCWEWGILPQVVHAAEGVGCERELSKLFVGALEIDEFSPYEVLMDSLEETGLATIPLLSKVSNIKEVMDRLNALVRIRAWRRHRVSLVGDGQGRRLLIVDDQTPFDIATVARELVRLSGIIASSPADPIKDIKAVFGVS